MFSFLKVRSVLFAAIGFGGVWLCGCDQQKKSADPDAIYMKAGYTQAPKIVSVTRLADGIVRVTGRAVPDGRVRLSSEQDRTVGLSADDKGVFVIDLPAQESGHLYELAMESDGRQMLAEGRLFVPPAGDGHIVLMRSGAPSLPLTADAPLIAVVDLDRAGAMVVSGHGSADAEVVISVNGQPLTHATTDTKGNYSAFLPIVHTQPVAALSLGVQSGTNKESIDIRFDGNYPKIGPQTPVVVARLEAGWRVAWTLPGGGAQMSIVY